MFFFFFFSACPVCYLPVEQAIANMPTSPSESPVLHNLTYVYDENPTRIEPHGGSEFGGFPTLRERNESYDIKESMTVHCGYVYTNEFYLLIVVHCTYCQFHYPSWLKQSSFLLFSGAFLSDLLKAINLVTSLDLMLMKWTLWSWRRPIR